MKKIILFFIMTAFISASSFPKNLCDQVVNKQVIEICYNYKVKGAKYVKYTIDGSKVNKVNIRKRPRFYTEKTIPARYRTKYSDYTYAIGSQDCGGNFNVNSDIDPEECKITYDRGHLAKSSL